MQKMKIKMEQSNTFSVEQETEKKRTCTKAILLRKENEHFNTRDEKKCETNLE